MRPCAQHLADANATMVARGVESRGDEAVASLWSSHGSAMLLAGVAVAAGDFCPLCVLESRVPGSAASWLSSACDAEAAAQLAASADKAAKAAAAKLAELAPAQLAAATEAAQASAARTEQPQGKPAP